MNQIAFDADSRVQGGGYVMPDIASRNPWLILGWSFGLFLLIHLGQYAGALLAMWRSGKSFDAIMSGAYEDHTTILMKGIGAVVAGIPLAWVAVAFLWGRSVVWMQLPFRGAWLMAGICLGLALPLLLVSILRLLGYASIGRSRSPLKRNRKAAWLLGVALLCLFTGGAEEIIFRAMAAREFSLLVGWPIAVLVSGTYFGLVHLIGQIRTLAVRRCLAIMGSSILVSFLFISMYVRSGSIWLPIGFHAAWNFSLVGILGLPMNAKEPEESLLQATLAGPGWLTGGVMGFEASGIAMLAYISLGLLFAVF